MNNIPQRDERRFTWDLDDVEFEKPDPNDKPLLTPEQRQVARENLEKLRRRGKI